MLFDLRGRGRRNVIKVIYLFLALLMGGGLIFFGIGGNQAGNPLESILGDTSGNTGVERYEKEIREMRARIAADNTDERAWTELIRAQMSLASTGENYDSATGTYTEAGKERLRTAVASWEEYQAIDPKNKEDEASIASRIVQAYASLENFEGLVAAQEVVAVNRETSGTYAQLAEFAYLAGQIRKGDLAAEKALELEDADQRGALKQRLDASRAQAAPQAVTPVPTVTATAPDEGGKGGKGEKSGE